MQSAATILELVDGDYDRCFFFDEKGNFIEGITLSDCLAKDTLPKSLVQKIVHDPRLVWEHAGICDDSAAAR